MGQFAICNQPPGTWHFDPPRTGWRASEPPLDNQKKAFEPPGTGQKTCEPPWDSQHFNPLGKPRATSSPPGTNVISRGCTPIKWNTWGTQSLGTRLPTSLTTEHVTGCNCIINGLRRPEVEVPNFPCAETTLSSSNTCRMHLPATVRTTSNLWPQGTPPLISNMPCLGFV